MVGSTLYKDLIGQVEQVKVYLRLSLVSYMTYSHVKILARLLVYFEKETHKVLK